MQRCCSAAVRLGLPALGLKHIHTAQPRIYLDRSEMPGSVQHWVDQMGGLMMIMLMVARTIFIVSGAWMHQLTCS